MSAVLEPDDMTVQPLRPAPTVITVAPAPHSGRRNLIESLVIFVSFGTLFGLLGNWVVADHHLTTFISLDRLAGAYLTWHGAPPKLAAIGFTLPPLQSVVLLPFTLISGMATSLVALPIVSAIFGGLTLASVNRLLERCDFPPALRYPILVLVGAIPTIAYYSANGDSEMISLALLTAALSGLVAWFRTVDTRFLISSGLTFGLATMADYTNIVYMLLAGAMIATVLGRHGADDAEVEGSLITYVAPAFYAIALWCMINWLIIDSPFGWVTAGGGGGATVNVASSFLAGHGPSVAGAFTGSLHLALDAAPLSLVIVPALLIAAIVQRNEFAAWLVAFALVAIFRPGADALIHANVADLQLSLTPPQLLMAVVGAAWLYQSLPQSRLFIGAGLIAGLVVSIVVTWTSLASYPYQDTEAAFHQLVAHGSTSTRTKSGIGVGVSQERAMADYIRTHVRGDESILTDNSQTYAVILLSGQPRLFVDRLSKGSGIFEADVRTPPRSIRYFLIAYDDPGDALRTAYPGAVSGAHNTLSVVYRDRRYALVAVGPGTTTRRVQSRKNKLPVPDGVVGDDIQ